jgi:hypothetical protein
LNELHFVRQLDAFNFGTSQIGLIRKDAHFWKFEFGQGGFQLKTLLLEQKSKKITAIPA